MLNLENQLLEIIENSTLETWVLLENSRSKSKSGSNIIFICRLRGQKNILLAIF